MKSSGNTMKTGKGPPAENKEKRRKKLNKRSRTVGPIKMKAMVHYTPTEEDISQLLKEFTVDFLLHGTLRSLNFSHLMNADFNSIRFYYRIQHSGGSIAPTAAATRFSATGQISFSLARHLLFALCFATRTRHGSLERHLFYWSALLFGLGRCSGDWTVWIGSPPAHGWSQAVPPSTPLGRHGHPWVSSSSRDVFTPCGSARKRSR